MRRRFLQGIGVTAVVSLWIIADVGLARNRSATVRAIR